MLLPKGQAVFEQLNTSFAQLDAMLGELNNDRFTGYVQVVAWDYEGILLLDTGNLVSALEDSKGQRRVGPAAASNIAVKAREKDGTINVYRLSEEMTELLAGAVKSELVFKDLASDFTSMDKLIAKLGGEKHTGHVEIRQSGGQQNATIFLRDGQVIETLVAKDGTVISGSAAYDEALKCAAQGTALFSVYRADLAKALAGGDEMVGSIALHDTLSLWQGILQQFENAIDPLVKPGAFVIALKREFVEHAKRFPFLDPFAAEFGYRNGELKFTGQAPVTQLNHGLSECLAQSLRRLIGENRNKITWQALQPTIGDLRSKCGARLEEIGLVSALPEAFE